MSFVIDVFVSPTVSMQVEDSRLQRSTSISHKTQVYFWQVTVCGDHTRSLLHNVLLFSFLDDQQRDGRFDALLSQKVQWVIPFVDRADSLCIYNALTDWIGEQGHFLSAIPQKGWWNSEWTPKSISNVHSYSYANRKAAKNSTWWGNPSVSGVHIMYIFYFYEM